MTARIRDYLRRTPDEGPRLVVDLDVVRDNYATFAKVLPDTRVFYAVKANPAPEVLSLLASLGSENVDCRPESSRLDPRLGRGSYIFNPTIAGIDNCDAVLIVGSNPRHEAAVLNARIRKRWRQGDLRVGLIGERVDLTYDYDYLGAGPESLAALIGGDGDFALIHHLRWIKAAAANPGHGAWHAWER